MSLLEHTDLITAFKRCFSLKICMFFKNNNNNFGILSSTPLWTFLSWSKSQRTVVFKNISFFYSEAISK